MGKLIIHASSGLKAYAENGVGMTYLWACWLIEVSKKDWALTDDVGYGIFWTEVGDETLDAASTCLYH